MFKNYLTIAFRTLTRNKLYTVINVAGLSVGIAGCILIMLFVQHEWSFDKFHQSADRIFRVVEVEKRVTGEKRISMFHPLPLAQALGTQFPEIEAAVPFLKLSGTVTYGEYSYGELFAFTAPEFLTMFSFPLLEGNSSTALASSHAIVMTEKVAKKYFGEDNPMGRRLIVTLEGQPEDFEVTGVAAPIPENSSLEFDFLLPVTRYPHYERSQELWGNFNCPIYIQLAKGAQISELESKLVPFIKTYFGPIIAENQNRGLMSKDKDALRLRFQPLTEIYLDTEVDVTQEHRSHPAYSYGLSGIALLVLLIACINFMTLAIGRSTTRAKEVGVRKVLGAVRFQLMKQFWGEALLLCTLSLLLGLMLAELSLPTFNQLAGRNLRLNYLCNGSALLALVGLLLFVALVAGSYPAAFLSQFQPVEVLKGKLKLGGKNLFTRSLVALQFGLSILFIISSLIMWKQLDFLRTKNLGYNPEQVVVIRTFAGSADTKEALLNRYRQKLAVYPNIINLTGASPALTRGLSRYSFQHDGVNRTVDVYRVDPHYLPTLGIELLEGRNFMEQRRADVREAVIVNEALVREWEWQAPVVGKRLTGWNDENVPAGPMVIGVVKDYHYRALHEKIKPMMLICDPDWPLSDIMVRISPENIPATIELLRKTWKEVAPNTPFEFYFLDEDVQNQYQTEERWGKIVAYASLFGILLACLGLFGLATLSANSRTKEIGIRKVLGASVSSIVNLFSQEFIRLVLLANLLAWPVAYYAMNYWLQDFAYRVEMSWWIFALAGGLALVIALLTVSTQAIKAALANPVDSLRYE